MALQESGVRLFADGTTGFLRDMGRATKSVDDFGKQGGIVSKTLGGLGGAVGTAAKVIGGVFVAGVGAAAAGIGLSVKETISLESAFAGVIKTTDGLADSTGGLTEEGETLLQGFRDMAKDVPVAVEELMAIGELGGQLGIAREDLLEFTSTIAAMGEATNLTTEEAAVGFAQLANIMGTPTDQISNMGSSVVALGNNMATTERDIFNFSQRIAGAGEIAGLTESDVFGISAAFTSVGIEAASGGTAVQKVLLDMNDAVINGGDNMETFASTAGMSVDEFANAWETDAAGAFESFVSGLGEAGDDAMGILSDLGLEDQRLIKAFLSLSQATSSTDEEVSLLAESLGISAEAFKENTALMTEADARYATTESQIQTFKNSLRDIGFTIGGLVMPMFNDLLSALRPLIEGFGSLVSGDIDGFLEGVGFAAGDLAKMFGATDEQAAAFSEFVTQVVEWFTVNIPLAIGELRAIWAEAWPEIQQFLADTWEFIEPILISIGEWLTEEGPGVLETWKTAFEEAWGVISEVIESFAAWFEENKELIVATGEALADFWQNNLKPATETAWNAIKSLVSDAVTAVQNIIELVMNIITGDWDAAWVNIGEILSSTWSAIETFLAGTLEFIANLFGSSMDEIGQTWTDNWEAFKDVLTLAWDVITETFTTKLDDIQSELKSMIANFTTIGADMMAGLKQGILNGVQGVIDSVVGAVKSAISAAKSFIQSDSPSKLAADVLGKPIPQGVAEGVVSAEPMFTNTLVDMFDKSFEALNSKIVSESSGSIAESVSSIWELGAAILAENSTPTPDFDDSGRSSIMPIAENLISDVVRASPVDTLSNPGQIINNTSSSNDVIINFEGNYASQPAIRDQNDLAFVLGLAGT